MNFAYALVAAVLFFPAVSSAGCEEDRFDQEQIIRGTLQGDSKAQIEFYIDLADDLPAERRARIHAYLDELYTMPDIQTAMQVWGKRIQECKDI